MAQPLRYAPRLESFRPVQRFQLGEYVCVVVTDCKGTGGIQYTHVMFVLHGSDQHPCLALAAEVNASERSRTGPGSHFLGLFPGEGHANYGCDEDWGRLDVFVPAALRLAAQRLGVSEAPVDVTAPARKPWWKFW